MELKLIINLNKFEVHNDPLRLRKMVFNIIGNLLYYSESSVINLEVTHYQKDYIMFIISN